MFSNDYFLEENHEKLYNWDMDQNSIFSSTKEDLPYFNLFDNSSDKHYLLLNSFSDHGTTDSIGKYPKDESKHPTTDAEDSLKAKKKIFKVKKYVEYDEILKEIYTEGEENNEEISKTKNKLLNRKRFTLKKKEESFVKLSQKEKVEKLSKLSKLVKRYRRKYTCLQGKIKNNITKIFQKYLYEKLKINYKNKYLNHNLNLDLYQLIKTLRRLHNINNCEYSDQKNVLENLINSIADNKLPFDSINFKKICTQIRLFLPKEKIKYINKKGSQITIQFPQREVKITKKEYETYHKYINKNDVLRQIFGMEKSVSLYTNPANSNNFQLIPIITLPTINLPLKEIIPNGKQAFLVINGKNVSLGGNEVRENVLYNQNQSTDKNDNLKEPSIIQFPLQNDSHKNLLNPIYLIAAKDNTWE
jgi:hypothetical protein